jgi:hypothetical protein
MLNVSAKITNIIYSVTIGKNEKYTYMPNKGKMMKLKSLVVLAFVPLIYGCASTTVKTYSGNFEVKPVETKSGPQQFYFKSVVTETIYTPDGEITSFDWETGLTTMLGVPGKVSVGSGDNRKQNHLEAKIEDLGYEYQASLRATIQPTLDEDPVICTQTITIKK